MKYVLACLSLLWSACALTAPESDLWLFWDKQNPASSEQINHKPWQQILARYLDAEHASGVNRFNYTAVVAEDKALLADYLHGLQAVDPRSLNRAQQKAYWINLYNAHTVQLVLQAYPVKSILKVQGGIFGRGPWHKKTLKIAEQALSLNDVEHRILRPIWNDHRIHFAVNCASIGCPNLLPTAYTASNTEALLQKAAKDYLRHPRGLRFEGETLHLSKIFDWYQVDFGDSKAEMLKTLAQYLPNQRQQRLKTFSGRIKYHYDWSLNQP